MNPTELVLWAGLALGLIFGCSNQVSGFCLYRGLSERWSGHSSAKLQAFALALAIALAGTHLIHSWGLVDMKQSIYLSPSFSWLLIPLGGIIFGYGMGLANGCGARALVLLAQGNLRSLLVLLCLGVAAYITLTGVLAPLRLYLHSLTTVTLPQSSLAEGTVRSVIIVIIVGVLGFFALKPSDKPRSAVDLIGGVIVGLLIVGGWLTTGWLGADPFEPAPLTSLSFVAPVGDTIQYAMLSTGLSLRFSTVVVLGVIVGAFLTALLRGRLQLEGFNSATQMARYSLGGILMGVGGVLALGCTIGQGLSGLSTLSYSSIIAIFSIVIGARLSQLTGRVNRGVNGTL